MKNYSLTTVVVLSVTGLALAGEGNHDQDKASPTLGNVYMRALQTNDACALDNLTQKCSIFDPNGKTKIAFPDGTYIPNFNAMAKQILDEKKKQPEPTGATPGQGKDLIEQLETGKTKTLDIKDDVRAILDKIPAEKLHAKTKLYLTESLLPLELVSDQSKGVSVFIPWPVENPQRVKAVPVAEVKEKLLSLFSPDQKQKLVDLLARARPASQAPSVDPVRRLAEQFMTEMREVTAERMLKVKSLVETAREGVIREIREAPPLGKMTEAKEAAIEKLRDVQVTDFDDPNLKKSPGCSQLVPNAFYSPMEHSINICRNMFNYPDSALIYVIAHELTHAVDTCNSQFGVYDVDPAKLTALVDPKEKKPIPEVRSDKGRVRLLSRLWAANAKKKDGLKLTAFPFSLYESQSTLNYFVTRGVLKPRKGVGNALPDYVFRDAYACVKSKRGGHFRGQEVRDIEAMAEIVSRRRAETKGPEYDREADEIAIIEAFTRHPECAPITAHSQMGEVISDKIGARVVGEFLKEQKTKLTKPEEKLAPISFFSSLVCLERTNPRDSGNKDDLSSSDIVNSALEEYKKSLNEHPEHKRRLEDITLRDPSVRKALECGKLGDETC